VVRDLLGSTIASECGSHAPARRRPREESGRSGAHPHPLRTLGSRRHQNLHYSKARQHVCHGCRKTFSRLDVINVSAWSIAVHPSLPISSTLTLPFFDPCLSISAFGRFRTIPSDTVSFWVSDLRSEALTKILAFFSPLSRPLVRSDGGVKCRQTQEAAIVADRLSASPDDGAYDLQQRSSGSASTPSLSPR